MQESPYRKHELSHCKHYVRSRRKLLVALVVFGVKSSEKICHALNILDIDYRLLLPQEVPSFTPTHIILSGGPKHVYSSDHYPLPQWVIDSKCPVLGICYGMQIIAHTFGGKVTRMEEKEEGPIEVTEIIDMSCKGRKDKILVQETNIRWMNRYDRVVSVPNIFNVTGVTSKNHIAAFTDNKKWWTVQYHPESLKHGDLKVLKRFLLRRHRT